MKDQEQKQMAELVGKIELTLSQMLEGQRERSKSENDWFAADIRLREQQIDGQRALIEQNRAAQRAYKRTILVIGMLVGVMLLMGLGLLTEPWWMPMIMGGHQ